MEQGPEVWSVDHDGDWLAQTGKFLRNKGLPDDRLYTWSEFQAIPKPRFDLILHDMGYLSNDGYIEERANVFEEILNILNPGGIVVIDDFQVLAYRRAIFKRAGERQVSMRSLRWLTLDQYMRYACLVY